MTKLLINPAPHGRHWTDRTPRHLPKPFKGSAFAAYEKEWGDERDVKGYVEFYQSRKAKEYYESIEKES